MERDLEGCISDRTDLQEELASVEESQLALVDLTSAHETLQEDFKILEEELEVQPPPP